MKMPNGYGTIFKLSGKRRKPWVARKTIGWKQIPDKDTSYPIYQVIGYFEKREQALEALVEFNKSPYDINVQKITFSEIYDKWSEKKFPEISDSNAKGYRASYLLCSSIKDMNFVDIKLDNLQDVVDKSNKNQPTLRKLKVLFGQIYDYAIMHEIISKERDLVQYVDISKAGNPNAFNRKPFTKKEVQTLWKWKNASEYFQIILMLIYTGVRISELLDLKKININLNEKWFDVVSSKTEAGIRKVPIAEKVFPFFEFWMNKNECEYLLSTPEGQHFEYRNYYDSYWAPLVEQMGIEHTPHCTRHTCISFLTTASVDERIIRKIVGHKGIGVTQQVYTHIEIEELLDAINKI
jgi:integrase